MSRMIADTYEIGEEIGAGGGGVVYLGTHVRLGKRIVLKEDRRSLSAKPETLRREVDALKDLSHTYIPQVYDFIQEDGSVYTVMDYIPGESVDKILDRDGKIPQPRVVEWACELLDALSYLHNRPPYGILHGDIKPANIMVTPENDIRLIDFNIALALGEEGAVRVGFSRGYASPEHYGLDYSTPYTTITTTRGPKAETKTEVPTDTLSAAANPNDSTLREAAPPPKREKKTILLDVRSDIYSVGATLYHMLLGVKPDWDAKQVAPIPKGSCSPAVAAIIAKAMAPDPNQRYQTAQEMWQAFRQLHTKDPRVIRLHRLMTFTAVLLAGTFLAGGSSTFIGLRRMERQENAYALAEYSANALRSGDVGGAIDYALQALPLEPDIFDPPYTPQAQKALTDALGVYELADGFQAYTALPLPSAPLKVELSPSGKRLAVFYAYEVAVYDLDTIEQLVTLPMEESALADVFFVGEDTLVYAGAGGIRAYSLAEQRELWSGQPATTLSVSADGSRVAAVYKDDDHATIYNMTDGSIYQTISFGEHRPTAIPNDRFIVSKYDLFALNADGTFLAASFADGALLIFDATKTLGDLTIFPASDYTNFNGGFYDRYLAFACTDSNQHSMFDITDAISGVRIGGFEDTRPFHVQTKTDGIYLSHDDTVIQLDPETYEQTEVAYLEQETISGFSVGTDYTLVASEANNYALFHTGAVLTTSGTAAYPCHFLAAAGDYALLGSRDTPDLRIFQREDHRTADVFSYDPTYQHDEARISADRSTVMLFDAERFRLYTITGELLADVTLPDAANIYDQQYRRDETGSRLEVIYYDGTIRAYSAVDGSLLSETKGDPKDPNLTEEFYTDRYRIVWQLYQPPQVYDREAGELVCELEKDDALGYVTQVGDQIITQYFPADAQDKPYGLLLDADCNTLARLPYLSDVWDNTLFFDFPTGIVRQSRIYSIDELLSMARN